MRSREISCEGPGAAAPSGRISGSASEGSQVPTQNVWLLPSNDAEIFKIRTSFAGAARSKQTFDTGYVRHIQVCSSVPILQLSQRPHTCVRISFTLKNFFFFYVSLSAGTGADTCHREARRTSFLACLYLFATRRFYRPDWLSKLSDAQGRLFPSPDAACAFSTI